MASIRNTAKQHYSEATQASGQETCDHDNSCVGYSNMPGRGLTGSNASLKSVRPPLSGSLREIEARLASVEEILTALHDGMQGSDQECCADGGPTAPGAFATIDRIFSTLNTLESVAARLQQSIG